MNIKHCLFIIPFAFLSLISWESLAQESTSGYYYDPVYFRKKDRAAMPKIQKIKIDTTLIPKIDPVIVKPTKEDESEPSNPNRFEGGGVAQEQSTNSPWILAARYDVFWLYSKQEFDEAAH
ncbi:MAG: hypothetical protein EAZ57_00410 [Cytophagales bacterium]|nr:MAG: hypothetical protein EAZ67_00720 [Cytophagales bacterium]TAF62255.1 MAG: hypothetical protein EAZ57_00410 [Cytophagales bacterium]